eukprot:3911651-Prymnesium_polylepis.1
MAHRGGRAHFLVSAALTGITSCSRWLSNKTILSARGRMSCSSPDGRCNLNCGQDPPGRILGVRVAAIEATLAVARQLRVLDLCQRPAPHICRVIHRCSCVVCSGLVAPGCSTPRDALVRWPTVLVTRSMDAAPIVHRQSVELQRHPVEERVELTNVVRGWVDHRGFAPPVAPQNIRAHAVTGHSAANTPSLHEWQQLAKLRLQRPRQGTST